jgi:hypothetical protein
MNLVFQLRIDFAPGPVPGQLAATVRVYTLDGVQIGDSQVYPVAVGQSLTLRPLSTSVIASAAVGPTPPLPPEKVAR